MSKAATAASGGAAYPHRARREQNDQVIREAMGILEKRLRRPHSETITSPAAAISLVQLRLSAEEREHFEVIYLTTKHQLIAHERLFSGTIDGASVHPREVVKRALELNAAAVIFAHNHPSGNPEPSKDDVAITSRLQSVLSVVDIRVLDHIIVGGLDYCSMAREELI